MGEVQGSHHIVRKYVASKLLLSLILVNCIALLVDGSNKVVGGVEARKGEFPWIVTFATKKEFCAGTLIHPSWVLTAAHCGTEHPSAHRVKAGVHNLVTPSRSEVSKAVSNIYVYPYYDPHSGKNDIALVKLSSPFKLEDGVSTIDIASRDFIVTEEAELAGWGVEDQDSKEQPESLLKVTLTIVPNYRCRSFYDSSNSKLQVFDSVMCAGGNGKSACFGDSGGPLMCKMPENKYVVCGLVSAGLQCGEMGIFTRISFYRDWIQWYTGF